jgi:hypothetical protein
VTRRSRKRNPRLRKARKNSYSNLALSPVGLEPGGSAEGTVAGKIRKRRRIASPGMGSLLKPARVISDPAPHLRPAAYEMPYLRLRR